MNRHGKFYAELETELNDYYDDEDEEDDDDYYEGEGEGACNEEHGVAGEGEHDETHTDEHDGSAAAAAAAAATKTKAVTTDVPADNTRASNGDAGNSNSSSTTRTTTTTATTTAAMIAATASGGRALRIGGTTAVAPAAPPSHAPPGQPTTLAAGAPAKPAAAASAPGVAHEHTTTTTTASTSSTRGVAAAAAVAQQQQHGAGKPQCTLVVAGHVDAGKSTTLGHLLLLLGRVAAAEVERNEREGRQSHKESFKYAWLLDQSEEERRRGVTIDAGSFVFDTPHRRVHVLDAPGHKEFVLSMISSATLADAALLVVTAAPSEFETGLAHGTREHLLVLKTLGVGSIVVAVNKMDVVDYAHERYAYVVREVQQLLRQMRIKESIVTGFCPVSGMTGANLVTRDVCAMPWYDGATLLDLLDRCPLESRLVQAPLRVSVQDVQGSTLYGKVESGTLRRGETLLCVPGNVKVLVRRLESPTMTASSNNNSSNNNNSNSGGAGMAVAAAGDTVEVTSNAPLTGVTPGCIACALTQPLLVSTDVEAHVQTFETLARSILPGATFTMAVHALTVPVRVIALVSVRNGKTGEWSRGMVKTVPSSTQAIVLLRAESAIAVEAAETCRALGRFVLRQDGETVAGGLVKRVVPVAQ